MPSPSARPLHRTECVTFPRSGHSLVARLLHAYYGDGRLSYCEQYEHPHRILEVDAATNFQKNHDLDLDTPVRDDRRYVVQIRYPLESIVSWYTLNCARGNVPDEPAAWTSFAVQKAAFWMRFYRRWVLDTVPARLIVNYADVVAAPEATLTRLIEHIDPEPVDADRVADACGIEAIAVRSSLRAFRHYGPAFFGFLRDLFSAVPGVDPAHDRLVVPEPGGAGMTAALGTVVCELRGAGADLTAAADRLDAIASVAAGTGASAGAGAQASANQPEPGRRGEDRSAAPGPAAAHLAGTV